MCHFNKLTVYRSNALELTCHFLTVLCSPPLDPHCRFDLASASSLETRRPKFSAMIRRASDPAKMTLQRRVSNLTDNLAPNCITV